MTEGRGERGNRGRGVDRVKESGRGVKRGSGVWEGERDETERRERWGEREIERGGVREREAG